MHLVNDKLLKNNTLLGILKTKKNRRTKTMNNASNNTKAQSSLVDLSLLLADTAVNIIGIAGNLLLIIAHIKDPLKLLKSPSSLFIFNIAFNDFLISCVLVIYQYSYHIFAVNPDTLVVAIDIGDELMGLFYFVSLSLYLSLAIERLWSVTFPLWHRVRITRSKCRYFIAGLWLFFVVFKVGTAVLMRISTEIKIQLELAYIVLLWVIFFLIQCVYVGSYVSIRKKRTQLHKRDDMSEANSSAIKARLKNENNFLLTIAIVCSILAVTTLPFLTMLFMFVVKESANPEKNYKKDVPSYLMWGLLAVSVNSAINVFAYLWRFPNYRKTFKKLYCDR